MQLSANSAHIDPNEVAKFDKLAASWWNPAGPSKPLHEINPIRLQFVQDAAPLSGKQVLDVGCGGGILSESMAKGGAIVTGIDASEKAIAVAKQHASESKLSIDYQIITAEALTATHAEQFDVLTCMEMLEHVPDPASTIQACANLVRPGGSLFFSTVNRTLKAYLLAVIGAEYIINILPKGTHDYSKFIRPSELDAWARKAGLTLQKTTGMHYNPITAHCKLTPNLQINYLVHFQRD